MAAAEARAVWQRTANRCFVQEDAKRAPKLACCQSSSSSSKQVDGGPTSAVDMPNHPAVGFMPLNRCPSFSNLPPDIRWWLQRQPSYGYQKGLTPEQVNALEAELENLRAGTSGMPCKISDSQDDRDGESPVSHKIYESYFNDHCRICTDCLSRDGKVRKQDIKPSYSNSAQEFTEFFDTRENSKSIDRDPIGCPKIQKGNEYCFDPESPWIGDETNLPWWRTDKDDLPSLVAQKSHDFIENCDLPSPQKMHIRRYPSTHSGSSDHNGTLVSSSDWKAQTSYISSPIVCAQACTNSESMGGREGASIEGHLPSSSDNSFCDCTTLKETTQKGLVSEDDPCKTQLLEALRHSQTRAREAEKAAKQAYAEKEHIVKLFLRQASQLFAYKQWLEILQLEALYHQMKNGDQPMSTLFPVVLPWRMPQKGSKRLRKSWQKSTKGKRGHARHDIGNYAVALALGLSLVGAGLLLGWTVGWMLPW